MFHFKNSSINNATFEHVGGRKSVKSVKKSVLGIARKSEIIMQKTDNREVIFLVVEDNPADQKLTMKALSRNSEKNVVVIANDGQEALDYLNGHGEFGNRKKHPFPDIMLLDINMPRLNGKDLLQRIRVSERLKHLPVIMLTNSVYEVDVVESYRLGANAYVQKPVTIGEFFEAVDNLENFWLNTTRLPGYYQN